MLKSLLVGLDGTEGTQSTLALGLRWAKRFGTLLAGIGIIDTPEICKPQMMPIGASWHKKRADEARHQRAQEQVERIL